MAVLAAGLPSVQGEPVKVPAPSLEKVTVPVGALAVPDEVSVTVAKHVVTTLTSTGFGEQRNTTVEVVRRPTMIAADTVEELALCVVSVAAGA